MDQEFRRFLEATYSGFLSGIALEVLYGEHGVLARFRDETKGAFRTDAELKKLEETFLARAQRMTRELVDELESNGFNTIEDFENKKPQLRDIVDKYHHRLVEKLSDL